MYKIKCVQRPLFQVRNISSSHNLFPLQYYSWKQEEAKVSHKIYKEETGPALGYLEQGTMQQR